MWGLSPERDFPLAKGEPQALPVDINLRLKRFNATPNEQEPTSFHAL
jgi:hypothetical protein